MIPDFSGDYLKYDETADGDVVTITGKGKVEHSKELGKSLFNVPVEHNGKEKTYSPNNACGKTLQDAFGKDADEWVGKQFQVIHVDKKMSIRPIKK